MFRSTLAYLLTVIMLTFTAGCAPTINSSQTEGFRDTTLIKAKPFTGTIKIERLRLVLNRIWVGPTFPLTQSTIPMLLCLISR